jgi:hypothetical protein
MGTYRGRSEQDLGTYAGEIVASARSTTALGRRTTPETMSSVMRRQDMRRHIATALPSRSSLRPPPTDRLRMEDSEATIPGIRDSERRRRRGRRMVLAGGVNLRRRRPVLVAAAAIAKERRWGGRERAKCFLFLALGV